MGRYQRVSLAVDKGLMMNPIELRRLMAQKLDEADEIANRAMRANRSLTAMEQSRVDSLLAEAERLKDEAEEVERRIGYTGPLRGPAEQMRPTADMVHEDTTGIELRDGQTFASMTGRYDGPDLGLILRGAAGLGGAEARDAVSGLIGAAGEILMPSFIAGTIIDRAMEMSVLVRAGAARIAMQARTHTVPRIAADPVLSWRPELGVVAESKEPGIDGTELTAKSVSGVAVVSMEALEDAVGLENAVTASLSRAVARAIDKAALSESSVTNGPATLFGDAAIAVASNAEWKPAWGDVADIAAELADAEGGELDWLIVPHPDIATIRKTQATTSGTWLGPVPGLENVALLGSVAVADDSTYVLAGSGRGAIAIGMINSIRIVLLRERYMVSQSYTVGVGSDNIGGAVGFMVHARVDVAAVDPQRLLRVPRAVG